MDCEPWPIDDTCHDGALPEDPDVLSRLQAAASEILHVLSGRTVGLCRYRVRPCKADYDDPCQGVCGCAQVCSVWIGRGDVECVEAVRINGAYIPRTAWRLYDGGKLVLTPPYCFPPCQDLSRASSQVGTWEVTYLAGRRPGALAARAMGALVAALWRECESECATLDVRATSVTADGMTFTREPGEWQRAGIAAVDDFVEAVNPYRARRQLAVYSPDEPTVWTDIGG